MLGGVFGIDNASLTRAPLVSPCIGRSSTCRRPGAEVCDRSSKLGCRSTSTASRRPSRLFATRRPIAWYEDDHAQPSGRCVSIEREPPQPRAVERYVDREQCVCGGSIVAKCCTSCSPTTSRSCGVRRALQLLRHVVPVLPHVSSRVAEEVVSRCLLATPGSESPPPTNRCCASRSTEVRLLIRLCTTGQH